MNVIPDAKLPDVLRIEPRAFGDARGFFFESHQVERYTAAGIVGPFVQDNISRSARGTLRGLHFQIERSQAKLVQVIRGAIFDVAVDVRKSSPTFGHWTGHVLSDENHHQLYIPVGFAHGFCVLSEVADVLYKCTDTYFPQHERAIQWNDPAIGIAWPLEVPPILSAKDQQGKPLAEAETFT
jgi:dTDP-4-dehydrorhamnose 3,5-epimerase